MPKTRAEQAPIPDFIIAAAGQRSRNGTRPPCDVRTGDSNEGLYPLLGTTLPIMPQTGRELRRLMNLASTRNPHFRKCC